MKPIARIFILILLTCLFWGCNDERKETHEPNSPTVETKTTTTEKIERCDFSVYSFETYYESVDGKDILQFVSEKYSGWDEHASMNYAIKKSGFSLNLIQVLKNQQIIKAFKPKIKEIYQNFSQVSNAPIINAFITNLHGHEGEDYELEFIFQSKTSGCFLKYPIELDYH